MTTFPTITTDFSTLDNTSSSSSNFTWSNEDLFTWHGPSLIAIPIMMCLGIVGNMVVFYIYHFRWPSNTVTLVIRMLAGIDLTYLLLAMPLMLHLTINPWTPDFVPTCRFMSFVALTTATTSSIVLIIIAVDRFARLRLMRKTGISSVDAKKLFLISIIAAIIINFPTLILYGRRIIEFRDYNVRAPYCRVDKSKSKLFSSVWKIIVGIAFIVTTTTLVVLYTKIVRTLRKLTRKHDELQRRPSLAAGNEAVQKSKRSKLMQSTSWLFTAITIVYFCSYAPYFGIIVLSLVNPNFEGSLGPKQKIIYSLCKLSPLVNNVANPFIYSWSSPRFRAELKKIVTLSVFQKGAFRRSAVAGESSKSSDWEMATVSTSRD